MAPPPPSSSSLCRSPFLLPLPPSSISPPTSDLFPPARRTVYLHSFPLPRLLDIRASVPSSHARFFPPGFFLSQKSPWKSSSLAGFLPNSSPEDDGEPTQRRKRGGKYAVLSLCAQSMLAQSPLLCLLLKYGPYIVENLSVEEDGRRGGATDFRGFRDPEAMDSSSSAPILHWRTLIVGVLLGAAVTATYKWKPVDIGCMIDASLWLCVLCSMIFFIGCATRTAMEVGLQLLRIRVPKLRHGYLLLRESASNILYRILKCNMWYHNQAYSKKKEAAAAAPMKQRPWSFVDGEDSKCRWRKSESRIAAFLPQLLLKQLNL